MQKLFKKNDVLVENLTDYYTKVYTKTPKKYVHI